MDRYELKRITQGKYRKFKRNWKCFIQYLVKNYLCDNSKFPHSRWNYHFSILYDHDPSITTNPLENINLKDMFLRMRDGIKVHNLANLRCLIYPIAKLMLLSLSLSVNLSSHETKFQIVKYFQYFFVLKPP